MGNYLDDHIRELMANQPSSEDIVNGEIMEEYKKMQMFRIQSLTIKNHLVLREIHLNFCQNSDFEHRAEDIHSSVVIGVNGIGKSYLLRAISDIFVYLEWIITQHDEIKKEPNFKFQIKYFLHGWAYEFGNYGDFGGKGKYHELYTRFYCKRGGMYVSYDKMELPDKVIASTMTFNDKFNTAVSERYKYKGIRNENSPGTTGTRTMIRKTVSSILHSLDVKEGFREEVKSLLEALGLEPRMEVTYSLRYKDVFLKEDMSADKLIEIFSNQGQYFEERGTKLWGTKNFEKIRGDREKLNKAAEFLRNQAARNHGTRHRKVVLSYHVLEENNIVWDRDAIEILSSLDLLTFPSLRVYKQDDEFDFSESSSGETHMLCQMLGIMSDIQHGSLVLIDEPETSAHPNWQINYVGWLKKIFKAYSDCHFIIATHSHFILTDLKPESSDIIALERNKDRSIKDVSEGLNTFNWSVDDILYRVFHVRNTRNYTFEQRLFELYHCLENSEEYMPRIKELYNELKRYELDEEDPLVHLLKVAEKCLN
jgi:predicted ATPase